MDIFTWVTIIVGALSYFGFLWALKVVGKKIIALTWIPWRAIYLSIIWAINDDSTTRTESIEAAFASTFYAVVFLISVHYTFPFFLKESNNTCAGTITAWIVSIIILALAFTLTWFALTTSDPNWSLGIGAIGLILNSLHLYFFHHPTTPHEVLDPKKITWVSILVSTITAFVVLFTIGLLSNSGLHTLSGILYNFPLLVIVTVASLGCKDLNGKMSALYDFIYILLHTVFIGNVFLGWYWYFTMTPWSDVVNIVFSSTLALLISGIMYLYVFRIGLEAKSGEDVQKMSTDKPATFAASAPYRMVRHFSPNRHRPQDTTFRF